eukprot:6211531-Pleurochrysis_carterae.AAC.1
MAIVAAAVAAGLKARVETTATVASVDVDAADAAESSFAAMVAASQEQSRDRPSECPPPLAVEISQ